MFHVLKISSSPLKWLWRFLLHSLWYGRPSGTCLKLSWRHYSRLANLCTFIVSHKHILWIYLTISYANITFTISTFTKDLLLNLKQLHTIQFKLQNIAQLLGLRPRPYRGSVPGPRWETSASRSPLLSTSSFNFYICRCATWCAPLSGYLNPPLSMGDFGEQPMEPLFTFFLLLLPLLLLLLLLLILLQLLLILFLFLLLLLLFLLCLILLLLLCYLVLLSGGSRILGLGG